MNTRSFVMSGVVPEIARYVVEKRIRIVPARIVVTRRELAGMMIVRNPGCMGEGDETGKQDHQHGVHRIDVERKTDDRPERQFHPQKHAEILGISEADTDNVDLMMQEQVDRVLDPTHLRSVASRPFRFVEFDMGALIEIVDVVPQIVMKNPTKRRYSGLERQADLEDSVHPVGTEGIEMLVVMIDRGDKYAANGKRENEKRCNPGRRKKEYRRMHAQHRVHIGYRSSIGFVA